MFVIQHRKIFFILTGILVAVAIGLVGIFGLNFGIEFTGGAITEVRYENDRPAKQGLENQLENVLHSNFVLQPTEENGYILRSRDLNEEELGAVMTVFSEDGAREVTRERFSQVGPAVGSELQRKALVALAAGIIAIILFVAYAFRKVSVPVSSWKYGLIAIVALLHDVIIPTGFVALLGVALGLEVDVLFVMALLAIIGYSVNDTIVVFDRVRENLKKNQEMNVEEEFHLTVGKSLEQTYLRSINTSLTTAFVLLAIFFLGGESTRDFALILLVGVVAGAYSSIFLATPLLVAWAGPHTFDDDARSASPKATS